VSFPVLAPNESHAGLGPASLSETGLAPPAVRSAALYRFPLRATGSVAVVIVSFVAAVTVVLAERLVPSESVTFTVTASGSGCLGLPPT
jgi:hypothetical protein